MCFRVYWFGFRVSSQQGLGFGFRVYRFGSGIGSGFRVYRFGFRVSSLNSACWHQCFVVMHVGAPTFQVRGRKVFVCVCVYGT
jgi:hypothetical protein